MSHDVILLLHNFYMTYVTPATEHDSKLWSFHSLQTIIRLELSFWMFELIVLPILVLYRLISRLKTLFGSVDQQVQKFYASTFDDRLGLTTSNFILAVPVTKNPAITCHWVCEDTLVHAFVTFRLDGCVGCGAKDHHRQTSTCAYSGADSVFSITRKFDRGLVKLMHSMLHWLSVLEWPMYTRQSSAAVPIISPTAAVRHRTLPVVSICTRAVHRSMFLNPTPTRRYKEKFWPDPSSRNSIRNFIDINVLQALGLSWKQLCNELAYVKGIKSKFKLRYGEHVQIISQCWHSETTSRKHVEFTRNW